MSLGKILIRADASVDIGTGHVMRCLALAQAWQDAGGSAVFALAKSTPAILKRLAAEGFDTLAVAAEPGCAEDADLTARLGVHHSVRWTVLDGYLFDGEFQQRVKNGGSRLLCVDDNADARRFCADIILNQNLHASLSMYGERMDGSSLLLGPSYALLRREFNRLRGWKREFDSPARTVLVMMGGSDPQNLSAVVIQALRMLGRSEIATTVVVGGSNPHVEELRQRARESKVSIQIVVDATNLPELMQSADLAISAAGSTCWEFCMLGLPAIVIDAAPNQLPIARELDRRLMAIHIPQAQVTTVHLAAKIGAILSAPEVLRHMSQRASAAVDGKGARRVVAAMRGQSITMRPAQATDCSLLWRWTNDPAVRNASFSSAEIPWEVHTFWFARRMADPGSTFLIFEEGSS
jgi:UDP-2,4-diacetamido-2,4,6-trideoxy-beta-L-altropyranose hydrolase